MPAFEVHVRFGDCPEIALVGDVGAEAVPQLRSAVAFVVGPSAAELVVDVSGVRRLGAEGLGVLAAARRRVGIVRLRGASSPVRAVVEAAGLGALLDGDG